MSKAYQVTLSARSTMLVWVEAETADQARRLAEAGDYDRMTPWEPEATPSVRRVVRVDAMPVTEYAP